MIIHSFGRISCSYYNLNFHFLYAFVHHNTRVCINYLFIFTALSFVMLSIFLSFNQDGMKAFLTVFLGVCEG